MLNETTNSFLLYSSGICFILSFIIKFMWAFAGISDAHLRYKKLTLKKWEYALSFKLLVGSFLYLLSGIAFLFGRESEPYILVVFSYVLAAASSWAGYIWVRRRFWNPDDYD